MRRKAIDTEKLVSTKIRASTKRKLEILKLLHQQRSDYDYLHLLVQQEYQRLSAEINALLSAQPAA